MINNQKFHQPHIRSKLKSGGAIESLGTFKARTRAMDIINSGGINILDNNINEMLTNPSKYIHADYVSEAWINLDFLTKKGVLPKKDPNRLLLDRIKNKLNQAQYKVGEAMLNYAKDQPPVGKTIFTTRGKVNMILSGIGIQ